MTGAALAGLIPVLPAFAAPASTPSLTFVLVHGAWHGGWCWQPLADLLRGAGHRVFTPTLTGCGERLHLSSPTTDLQTHVVDISATLHYEDLKDVVLVGHSYAGLVISQVAGDRPELIRTLVYLDAFLPEPGESFVDLTGQDVFAANGEGVEPMLTVSELGIEDARLQRFVAERLTPHPVETFRQRVEFDPSVLAALPRRFVQTSDLFAAEAARAASLGMEVTKLEAAGHDVMLTQPGLLAAMLIAIAD